MDSREKSILKTLLYADIFDFPLKKKEVWKFLISDKKISQKTLFKNIKSVKKIIQIENNYIFLKGRKKLIKLRQERQEISSQKFLKAKKLISKISFIPSIKFIGISGALSMYNSDRDDDIDLFVISQTGLVWTTRFLLVLILIFTGNYRYKKSKNYKDKICLNMILDEDNISFKKNNQNLYTAHEIIQLIPVFDRNRTYEVFIKKNSWTKNFLANAREQKKSYFKKHSTFLDNLIIKILKIIFLEEILKFIQFKNMEKDITKETLTKGFLAFHPFDYKKYILTVYSKKLLKYKI